METICGVDFNTDQFEGMGMFIDEPTDEEIRDYDILDDDFQDGYNW